MLLVFAMKCSKMPCPLPHNHYCCSLPSPVCLPHLLICTCLISPPIACPPSSVLCWCLLCFLFFCYMLHFFVTSFSLVCVHIFSFVMIFLFLNVISDIFLVGLHFVWPHIDLTVKNWLFVDLSTNTRKKVEHGPGLLWTWSIMNAVCYEHGLVWTWYIMNRSVSVMNVFCCEQVCNERGLFWMVCFGWSVVNRSVLNRHP